MPNYIIEAELVEEIPDPILDDREDPTLDDEAVQDEYEADGYNYGNDWEHGPRLDREII